MFKGSLKVIALVTLMTVSVQVNAKSAHEEFKGSCLAMSKGRIKAKKVTKEKAEAACECEAKVSVDACGSKCSTPEAIGMFMLELPKDVQTKMKACWK